MAIKNIGGFRPAPNVEVLNAIRGVATNAYQSRIPEATRANINDTVSLIMNHTPTRNEFISALVNRIGRVIARDNSWSNPLSKFKIGMLEYGDSIEEIATGLLNAYVYDDDREYMENVIFGTERPEAQSSFHSVNRKNFYKITVNDMQLRRAFLNANGLSEFVVNLMEAPVTSDEWDEFILMCSLFKENWDNGGFYSVRVPDISAPGSNEADAKGFLRLAREYAEKMKFISRDFNAAGLPVSAKPDDLELFITPEARAAMDVEALAGAFNISQADVTTRTTVIPRERFNIPGVQAVMTTRDFFVVADNVLETTEQFNPATLGTNYFLHHQQIISLSRFVPAILFSSEVVGDSVEIITGAITALGTITTADGDGKPVSTYAAGDLVQFSVPATVTPDDAPVPAVSWRVSGAESEQTRITNTGVLYIAGNETSTSLKVTAIVNDNDAITATKTITVAPGAAIWPRERDKIAGDSGDEPPAGGE